MNESGVTVRNAAAIRSTFLHIHLPTHHFGSTINAEVGDGEREGGLLFAR